MGHYLQELHENDKKKKNLAEKLKNQPEAIFAFILLFSLIIKLIFRGVFNMVLELSFYLDKLSNLTKSQKNNAAQTTQHCSAPESRADPQPD